MQSHSLVVLTLSRLYLTPMTGAPKPEIVAAIEQGGDLEAILGPLSTVINLPGIRRVRLDLVSDTLHVEYTAGGAAAAQAMVTFATSEAADAAFSKLWRRLGDEFQLRQLQANPMDLARGPVAVILAVVLTAGLLAIGLNALHDLAASRQWAVAGVLPSWQFVCGLAGAVAAAVTVWLHRRLTQPPERLDLVRDGFLLGSSLAIPATQSTPRGASA